MLSNKILAIQVELTDDGYHLGHTIWLQEKNNKITIEQRAIKANIDTFDFNGPVILTFSGKGILLKSFPTPIATIKDALHSVLPNSNEDDFLVQKINTANGCSVVITRIDKIKTIIQDFRSKGFFVLDVFLSPLELKHIEPLLQNNLLNECYAGEYLIKIQSGQIKDVIKHTASHSPEKMNIGGFELEQNEILPFSAAISKLLLNEQVVQQNTFDELVKENVQFNYVRKIKKTLSVAGFLLLGILLINAGFNISYQSKINQQKPMVVESGEQIKEKESLEKQIQALEKITGGKDNPSSSLSFYADRIAAQLPSNMQLSELKIHPFINEREKDSLNFRTNEIKISGMVNTAEAFNVWLNLLQQNKWCAKIIEQNFVQGINENSGKFNVLIDVR